MPKSLARSALLSREDARSGGAGAGTGAGAIAGAGAGGERAVVDAISTRGGGGGDEVVAISFPSILPSFLPSFRRAFYSFCGVKSGLQ